MPEKLKKEFAAYIHKTFDVRCVQLNQDHFEVMLRKGHKNPGIPHIWKDIPVYTTMEK